MSGSASSEVVLSLRSPGTDVGATDVIAAFVRERLSDVMEIEVHVLQAAASGKLFEALGQPFALSVQYGTMRRTFYGVLTEATLMGSIGMMPWWRLTVAPPLAGMALTTRSRCFLTTSRANARTVKDVFDLVLTTADTPTKSTGDYTLLDTYPSMAACLQVAETDLDFLKRTAEAAGISWTVQATAGSNDSASYSVAFIDQLGKFPTLPNGAGSASYAVDGTEITSLRYTQRMTTASVAVHSWDPTQTSTPALTGTAPASSGAPPASMVGTTHLWEQGFTSAASGNTLAAVRWQEARTRGTALEGESKVLAFAPGRVVTITDQLKPAGRPCLLTAVTHTLWQSLPGAESLRLRLIPEGVAVTGYANAFTAVSASATTDVYRPARSTPLPKIPGLLRATLCNASGGVGVLGSDGRPDTTKPTQAYMDAWGRYQVVLPFPDAASPGTAPGAIFAPLRLLVPYGGTQEGWQMPMRVGTTVYVAFEDGDIDRPIIVGVVPNAAQTSPVPVKDAKTQVLQSVVRSSSGITVKMTDGGQIVLPTAPS